MFFNKYDNGSGDLTPEEKVKATNAWLTVRPWLGDMHKYEVKENSKLLPYMHEIGQDKIPNIYVPYAGVNINPENYSPYEIPGGYTVYQDKKSGKYIITDPEYYENSDAWEWMQDKKLLGRDKVAIRYGNKDIYDLIGDPTNETRRAMMEENYPELLNQDWYKKLLTEHGIEFEKGGPLKSKEKQKEEKSILELRPWEKDDYIPNPTASVYPSYDYTPKFTKFGFLEIQPNELQLSGTAGFGFPKQGISADFVGTMPLKSNPFYKGSIGGGISKQLGDFNLGLNLSNQIAGYTDESGKFIQGVHDSEGKFIENKSRDLSKINPTIKLKYNFTNGGKVSNIPTWDYPSKGTPIYRDTTEVPPNTFAAGGFMSQSVTPPDMNPETLKLYQKELIAQENPKKEGFNPETQLWQPIESPEGGTPTLGYGAKLTGDEYKSGTIKIGDKQVNWREGLTDEEVEMIHMQDIKLSQSKAKTYIDNTYGAGVFDSLPQLSQMLATDYAYNTGNLSDWPKFTQALISGDIEGMKKEYVRTWENQEGERVPLKSRNRWTLAKINLLENIANEPSDDHDHATEESDRASIIDKNDPNFDILVTKRGGLNKKMLQFYNELNDLYLNETGTKLRITSGARHNTKGHHKSREEGAFAMDIGKEHGDVYSWLLNTKEGLELMNKYGLGILDETDPATMEKTGATGPHFHIGRDSGLKSRVERRLKMIQNDPASLPTLTAYINKNPKYKKAAEKLTTEQKQIVEQLPIRAKKSLFDKIYQEKLNSKVALDNELKIQVKNYNVHLDKLPKSFAFAPPQNLSLKGGIIPTNTRMRAHGGMLSNKFSNGGNPDPPVNPYYNIQTLQDKDLEFQSKWQGHKEYDPIGIQLTAEMFKPVSPKYAADTLEIEPFDQLKDKEGNLKFDKRGNPEYKEPEAWSAATTSNLAMAMLGATNAKEAAKKGFKVSAGHANYITEAFNTNFKNGQNKYNLYKAQKLDENVLNNLEIGEFVFKGRDETFDWKYEDFEKAAEKRLQTKKGGYHSHADIIIGKGEDENGKYVEVSGGNVNDTYLHRKKLYLDEIAAEYKGAMRFSEIARNQQLLSTEGPGIAELPTMPIQSIKDNVPTASRQNIMSLDDMIKAKEARRQFMDNKILEATKNKIY